MSQQQPAATNEETIVVGAPAPSEAGESSAKKAAPKPKPEKKKPLDERAKAFAKRHHGFMTLLMFIVAVACIALLAWWLLFSLFSSPPAFVYEEF